MDSYRNLLVIIPKFTIRSGMKFLQFLLFLVNFTFGMVGTLSIVAFFGVIDVDRKYRPFLGLQDSYYQILLVTIGVIMIVMALFGAVAATKESTLLANVYAAILVFLVVVEVNAAVSLFIIHGDIYTSIENNMHNSLNNQTAVSDDVINYWNNIQQIMDCCGINGAKDWAPLSVVGPKVEDYGSSYTVPFGCCNNVFVDYKSDMRCAVRFGGCLSKLRWSIREFIPVLVGTIAVAIVAQLIGFIVAYIFAKVIRGAKTEDEMKRQELQHLICSDLHQAEEERQALITSSSES